MAADLGGLLRGRRLQQRRAGARRRRHQAVPDALLDPRARATRRSPRRSSSSRSSTRRVGVLVLIFAFTQGVFPKPPDFSKLSSFDISYLAEHFRFTLFLITALAVVAPGRLRAAVRARQGVLGARAPGGHDPQRPPSLPARGGRAAGGRLAVPLRRLLVPARRLPRRRLGRERAARVRGQPGGGRGSVHPGRRRGAAGAAGEGLRRQRPGGGRGGLLGRSADRDRRLHRARRASARSSSSSASAPSKR